MNKRFYIFPLLLFPCVGLKAQNYLPVQLNYEQPFEKQVNSPSLELHPTIKPYDANQLNEHIDIDSVDTNRNLLIKIFKGDSVSDDKSSTLSVAPLFDGTIGYGTEGYTSMIANGNVGLQVDGNYKKSTYLNVNYLYGGGRFPWYVEDRINNTAVIPGYGYAHATDTDVNSYRNFSGFISYSPNNTFNFTLGHGKNFFGSGYRSLLLSDFANNYSYLRITTSIGKFKYVQLYANFKDISQNPYTDYFSMPNKFGAFHYLSWNIAKWFNASFFEAVIWPGKDGSVNRGFDLSYLNPVAFYRPVEYSIGSSDNSLMGLNLLIRISPRHQLYYQLLIDEFLLSGVKSAVKHNWLGDQTDPNWGWWANKQAMQVGYRWFDAFQLKGLNLRLEYNFVPPYTYSHTGGLLNYGHENQSLAHGSGANFHEVLGSLNYQRNHWYADISSAYQQIGKDTSGSNYGNNIYLDYLTHEKAYGNITGQGLTSSVLVNQLKVGYIILPKINMVAELSFLNRRESNALYSFSTNYVFFGLKTSLHNIYRDF